MIPVFDFHENGLVTFALFAFNQERFIGEAVASALAQDYTPLEIVLSDDCSTDRTYEIMRKISSDYEGPHDLRVVRNKENLGIASHVIERGREARGKYVVVAAGDDLSKSQRVSKLIPTFLDSTVWGVTSGFDLVDGEGSVTTRNHTVALGVSKSAGRYQAYLSTEEHVVIQGSTAAYRRELFELPMPPGRLDFAEDNLFTVMIYAHGHRVVALRDSLVLYRQHSRSLSNAASFSSKFRRLGAARHVRKMKAFKWLHRNAPSPGVINHEAVIESLEKARVSLWLPFLNRAAGSTREPSAVLRGLRKIHGFSLWARKLIAKNRVSLAKFGRRTSR